MMALLDMLKIDLGITGTAYDTRLSEYLTAAQQSIIAEGAATLDTTNAEDAGLVVMYAAWTFRRRDTMDAMPRMLRFKLNNRIFREKMQEET